MHAIRDNWRSVPLLLLGLAVPVSVSAGTIAVCLVYLGAAIALYLDRDRITWPDRSVGYALAALVGTYLLATALAAPYPRNWGKFGEELWIKVLLVAIPVLAGDRRRPLVWALRAAILAGTVAAAFAVVQYLLGYDPLRGHSVYLPQFGHATVSGFFGHHLSYGGQILVFVVFVTSWLVGCRSLRQRLRRAPVLVLLVLALLGNFARSAWLGTLAGLVALLLVRPARRRWIAPSILSAIVAVTLLVPPVRAHLLRIFQFDQHITRLNLWHSSWDGIRDNLLLGLGPGNFDQLLALYQVPGQYDNLAHAHNDLLMHGVNAGLPAMLAAVALLVVTCRLFLRAARRARADVAWIFYGALAVQVGITVAGVFQVFQTDDEVEMLLYFVLGCAVALAGQILRPVRDGTTVDDSAPRDP